MVYMFDRLSLIPFAAAEAAEAVESAGGLASFLHGFELSFTQIIHCITLVVEIMGVVILTVGAVKAFVTYFTKHENVRLSLAQSMALALEFKLGGEILRTVVARNWNEILTVGAIIALRGVLNFLIQWEINNIKHDADADGEQAKGGGTPSAKGNTETRQT